MTVQIPRDTTVGSGHGGVRIVLDGARGGGRLSVAECVLGEGYALPFHVHDREDEVVHVQEGELLVYLGGEERVLTAGNAMYLPRGVEHSFAAVCGGAKVLCTYTPAGFEEFLVEMDGIMASSSGVERLIAAAARYGCDITGEPPVGFTDFGDGMGGRT
ncbi:MAG: cupin domain-containing protein [Rubrobacteraceae bacterium]